MLTMRSFKPTLALSVILGLAGSVSAAWEFSFGDSEYTIVESMQSWEDGQAICSDLGGEMISINDATEQIYFQTVLLQTGAEFSIFIGVQSPWARWEDESLLSYTNWAGTQPSESSSLCGAADARAAGRWDGISCDSLLRTVCERVVCDDGAVDGKCLDDAPINREPDDTTEVEPTSAAEPTTEPSAETTEVSREGDTSGASKKKKGKKGKKGKKDEATNAGTSGSPNAKKGKDSKSGKGKKSKKSRDRRAVVEHSNSVDAPSPLQALAATVGTVALILGAIVSLR